MFKKIRNTMPLPRRRAVRFSPVTIVQEYPKPKVPKEELWLQQEEYNTILEDIKEEVRRWNSLGLEALLKELFVETQQVRFNAICQLPSYTSRGLENISCKRLGRAREACREATVRAVLSYQEQAQKKRRRKKRTIPTTVATTYTRRKTIDKQWTDIAFLSENHSYKASMFAQRMGKADGVVAHRGEDSSYCCRANKNKTNKTNNNSYVLPHQLQQEEGEGAMWTRRRRTTTTSTTFASSSSSNIQACGDVAEKVVAATTQMLFSSRRPTPLRRLVSV